MYLVVAYVLYLTLSIVMTIWVGRTLKKYGLVFLDDVFSANGALATAVNRLLVVGFYLINIGYVTLTLRSSSRPQDVAGLLEMTSSKVGWVLLVLGGMHLFNMYVLARIRRRALLRQTPPPVRPQGTIPGSEAAWRDIAPELEVRHA